MAKSNFWVLLVGQGCLCQESAKKCHTRYAQELFSHHGKITKVVLPPAKEGQENSRFGFVHFSERASAMKALQKTERYELEGKILLFASLV